MQHNGDLMLLLAYLLTLNAGWKSARIIIHTIVTEDDKIEEMKKNLDNLISEVRIKADR